MKRFEFGKNWLSFSRKALSQNRIETGRTDFKRLTEDIRLDGKTFLDIGFGQGLALYYALEQGASVTGCDIDGICFEAVKKTSQWFGSNTGEPCLIHGSILDKVTVDKLHFQAPGGYDVVHSWGVLHHTGAMYQAIQNASNLTSNGGYLILALYNAHWSSCIWKYIKKVYNLAPYYLKKAMEIFFVPIIFTAKMVCEKKVRFNKERGMDFMHDLIDWIGGYPYEYASRQSMAEFASCQGLTLLRFNPASTPTGCNKFVFRKGV